MASPDIKMGQVWEHHSGRMYIVLGLPNHAHPSDKFPASVYYIDINGNTWVRPVDQFIEKFKLKEEPKPDEPTKEELSLPLAPIIEQEPDIGELDTVIVTVGCPYCNKYETHKLKLGTIENSNAHQVKALCGEKEYLIVPSNTPWKGTKYG